MILELSNSEYKGRQGVHKFRADLQEVLRPKIFKIVSIEDLHFEALNSISLVNEGLTKDHKSISDAIHKMLKAFSLLGTASSISLSNGSRKRVETKHGNPIDLFQKYILGYDKVPKYELETLRNGVLSHLKGINTLIKEYERLPEIKELRDSAPRKRDIGNRKVIDFYQRCIREQEGILDHFLYGIYERALENSSAVLFDFLLTQKRILRLIHDYPYDFGKSWSLQNFDYRKIDCSRHRLNQLPYDCVHEDLYVHDKKEFYDQYFKQKSAKEIFENILSKTLQVPVGVGRVEIFEELQRLFFEKRWMAFYAIALPQVEGLFMEMVQTSTPKYFGRSLPEKVNKLRPEYWDSKGYFDYYQYILPEERNAFSHTGMAEGLELKSFDLLTDIEHLLEVFYGLENPVVRLVKIMRNKDLGSFRDLSDFQGFFRLLKEVSTAHSLEMKDDIDQFIDGFLKKECSLEAILGSVIESSHQTIENVLGAIKVSFPEQELHLKVGKKLTSKDIEKLKADSSLIDQLEFIIRHKIEDDINQVHWSYELLDAMKERSDQKVKIVERLRYLKKYKADLDRLQNLLE